MMGLGMRIKVGGAAKRQLVTVVPWLPTPSGETGLQNSNVSTDQGVTSKEKLRLGSSQTSGCTESKQAHPGVLP